MLTADDVLGAERAAAGDADYIGGVSTSLGKAKEKFAAYNRDIRSAIRQLDTQLALSVGAIADAISYVAVDQSGLMRADAGAAEIALRGYAREVRAIENRERALRRSVAGHLITLATVAANVRALSELLPPEAHNSVASWRTFPISTTSQFLDPRIDHATRTTLSQLRNRWEVCIASIDSDIKVHTALLGERHESNSRCVEALCRTTTGRRMDKYGARARTVTYAIASTRLDPTTMYGLGVLLTEAGSPQATQDVWFGLTAAQRAALVLAWPKLIGNLDGIPVLDRVAANKVNAAAHLRIIQGDGIDASEQELARYLTKVTTGEVSLVSYDPDGERIIEIIGKLSATTTDVVFYVPGTGTDMASFANHGVTQVGSYLNTESKENVVTLVYKDGPWISWLGDGETASNLDSDKLKQLGTKLTGFIDTIAIDPSLSPTVRLNAVGHSAGFTVVSAAEASGSTFDTVASLSGSYVVPGWQPNPSTMYAHFQYDSDFINVLDAAPAAVSSAKDDAKAMEWTPHENDTFAQFSYDDGAWLPQPFDGHSRSAEGPERNKPLLEDLLKHITLEESTQ